MSADLATGIKDGADLQYLNLIALISLLTKAVQELSVANTALTARLSAVEQLAGIKQKLLTVELKP